MDITPCRNLCHAVMLVKCKAMMHAAVLASVCHSYCGPPYDPCARSSYLKTPTHIQTSPQMRMHMPNKKTQFPKFARP